MLALTNNQSCDTNEFIKMKIYGHIGVFIENLVSQKSVKMYRILPVLKENIKMM